MSLLLHWVTFVYDSIIGIHRYVTTKGQRSMGRPVGGQGGDHRDHNALAGSEEAGH